jgi:hypothetical protein
MVDITLGYGRDKTIAVADLTKGGVSIAIASIPHSGPANILAVGRSSLSFEERPDGQAVGMLGSQIKEAGDAAQKILATKGQHSAISSIYTLVHAPWATSETVVTKAAFEEEREIDGSVISGLAREAMKGIKTIDASRLMEACVLSTELNGYPTRSPEGKYAHSVVATSLMSDCVPEVKSAATSALQSLFPVAKISWRSALRTYAVVSGQAHQKNFVIIDMGADSTHIISVHGGHLDQSFVGEGCRTILQKISGGRTADEALGALRMLSRDACSMDSCEAMRAAMAAIEPDLVRIFGESMAKLKSQKSLSNQMLLIAHPEMEFWLTKFFARIDFSQFTATTMPLEAQSIAVYTALYAEGTVPDASLLAGVSLVNIEMRA